MPNHPGNCIPCSYQPFSFLKYIFLTAAHSYCFLFILWTAEHYKYIISLCCSPSSPFDHLLYTFCISASLPHVQNIKKEQQVGFSKDRIPAGVDSTNATEVRNIAVSMPAKILSLVCISKCLIIQLKLYNCLLGVLIAGSGISLQKC